MTRHPGRPGLGLAAIVVLATSACGTTLPDTSDAVDVTASRVPEVVVRTATPTPSTPSPTPPSPTPTPFPSPSPSSSSSPSPSPAPSPTPSPTSTQVVTYGPDGLFRTDDGERRQLLDSPIMLAFDDGRGGAIFQRNEIGIGQIVDGDVVTLAFVREPATIELVSVDADAGTFTYRTRSDGETTTWVQAMDPEAQPRQVS